MKKRHVLYAVPLLIVAPLALAWVVRARLAGEIAQRYFAQHGIESSELAKEVAIAPDRASIFGK